MNHLSDFFTLIIVQEKGMFFKKRKTMTVQEKSMFFKKKEGVFPFYKYVLEMFWLLRKTT